ncbi:MAG: hypothetical protein KBD16_04030 [Candidatus Pacebacteria bacterium]|nr:hypothetical protein [Candidatus Paceibacterota bacterium]
MIRGSSNLDFHEKQRARRFLYSPLTFIVIGILILIAGYNAWDMYQKSKHTDEALKKSKEAYNELVVRETFLEGKITQLSTDAGIEAEIRERFGVAKTGEEVIVVLEEEEKEMMMPEKKGIWSRIEEWFTGADDDYIKGR